MKCPFGVGVAQSSGYLALGKRKYFIKYQTVLGYMGKDDGKGRLAYHKLRQRLNAVSNQLINLSRIEIWPLFATEFLQKPIPSNHVDSCLGFCYHSENNKCIKPCDVSKLSDCSGQIY